ncbi:MAG: hypothetical protein WBE72_22740 [Terracidiphilus sp.]
MSNSEVASLIVTQADARQNEEFLEVHIFGTFNVDSIESIKGTSKATKALDIAMIAWVKERLSALGKTWVEQ